MCVCKLIAGALDQAPIGSIRKRPSLCYLVSGTTEGTKWKQLEKKANKKGPEPSSVAAVIRALAVMIFPFRCFGGSIEKAS